MIFKNYMAKSFFIIVIFCVIKNSISISHNIDDRISDKIGDERLDAMQNNTIESSYLSSDIDRCIPVQAVRELGCTLSAKNVLFQGLFRAVCEQHQLCYACGFAHSITARQCNTLALIDMYALCVQNKLLSFSACLKRRFSAFTLLRQHTYRSFSDNPGFFYECQHQCVYDYLHAK